MKTHQKSDPKMNQNPSKITPKIDATKGSRRNARNLQRLSFQKISFGRKQRRKATEGWEQGGVQKVECKRHIQKGKCRKGTHTGLKHARWPATTCGFNPSAYGKVPHVVAERGFHRWGFLRCGCVRKVFQHLLFYKNGFEHQQKVKPNRTKTRFLKKFDIRREPKGSQREPKGNPKGAKREPKIKKIIKFFSLSFFFKIVKTVMTHLSVLRW